MGWSLGLGLWPYTKGGLKGRSMDWVLVLGICGFVYGVASDLIGESNLPENSNWRFALRVGKAVYNNLAKLKLGK